MNQIFSDLLKTEGLINPIPIDDFIFDFDSVFPIKAKRGKISFLLPQKREIFAGVGIIDLAKRGFLFPEGIYENREEKKIILPFSLTEALLDTEIRPRYFYYHPKRFPYEFVSSVSKGEIRKLFFNALREIYFWQGIEYQHIWYYPKGFYSAFIFRLDTDFAKAKEIEKTYQILKETKINATWFINAKEHKDLIPFFAELKKEGEDIQLHCFVHNLFPDYQRNYENIKKGKEILEKGGIEVKGFASPFGFFNQSLYSVLTDLDFSFSSEFGLSYDDFPFYPRIKGKEFPVLQIPIHPICFGRLLEAKFEIKEILEYYQNYIDWRYNNFLPIFLYDHPHRVSQFPELFQKIINYAKSKEGIWLTTMAEFAQWWKERERGGERAFLHTIKADRESFSEGRTLTRKTFYFPFNRAKIKAMRSEISQKINFKARVLFWQINKYLKGRTK
jgi:peptidoglycan/xylan/chitin deacetylase (PgdA/CDA1 family)